MRVPMSRSSKCLVLGAALLCVSGAQPTPTYRLLSIEPSVFPPNPFIPFPVVRDMHQTRLRVVVSPGAPLPDEVAFNAGLGPFTAPITQLIQIPNSGPPGWRAFECTTPHMLVPQLASGPVSIQAQKGSLRSNRLTGRLP